MFRKTEWLAAAALVATCTAAASQEVIATPESDLPGIRIEVTELSRTSGDMVMLKYRLFNETSESSTLNELTSSENVDEVELIDAAGKKKYLVIRDDHSECLCSRDVRDLDIDSGQFLNLWARFPAPPPEVKEVSVVFPHFFPTDVPISE